MATITGTVQILGMVSPTDTRDKYATHDDIYGKGGYRVISLIADLIKISPDRRKEGMIVYCLENKHYYILDGGILDEHFKPAKFGSSPGGFKNIEYLSDLDKIPLDDRTEGMLVYVLETNQYFQLLGGVETSNFQLVNFGGSTGGTDGTGDNAYIRVTPTPIAVGGAPIGTTFSGSVQDALDKILYPYIAPSFSTFTISGINTIYEVGAIIPAGNYTFNWSYSNNNIQENSIIIYDVDNSTIISNKSITPTTYVGNTKEIEFDTKRTLSFKILAKNNKGMNFEKLYSVSSNYYYYYGIGVDTISESDIKNMPGKSLDGTVINKVLNIPTTKYKWVCIPDIFNQPTQFFDNGTGFMVAMEAPVTIQVTNGFNKTINYKCYRTTNEMAQNLNLKIL